MSTMRSNLAATLFTKAQIAVLGLLFSHPDEAFYLRKIVALTNLGVGHVQRELQRLAGAGILLRNQRDRHVYFQVNAACPIYPELRGIVTKTIGAAHVLAEALGPLKENIRVAFIFGSVARGQENAGSDLDLMIVGDVTFREASAAIGKAEAQLLRPVNPVVYPPAEFRAKVAADHHFVNAVIRGEKVFVLGGHHELANVSAKQLDSAPPDESQRNPRLSPNRKPRHRAKPGPRSRS